MSKINNKTPKKLILFLALIFLLFGIWGTVVTIVLGLKSWGINNRVVWGLAIVNFIFWIGNAHSGTLISAVLYLLRQNWSIYIHRIAETITILSIVIAMFFLLIHLGRPWFFYWLLPLPNQMKLWTNFTSPLVWDVYAIIIYSILSISFWFLGFVPEIRNFKIYQISLLRKLTNLFWVGLEGNWEVYWQTYKLFAGLLTFVVISLHSIVSFDFATTFLPLWHSTIQPIFFIIGAIYSGTALVLLISLFIKCWSEKFSEVPDSVFEKLAKILLTFSLMMFYFYFFEFFFLNYSQNNFESKVFSILLKDSFLYIFLLIFFKCYSSTISLDSSISEKQKNIAFNFSYGNYWNVA